MSITSLLQLIMVAILFAMQSAAIFASGCPAQLVLYTSFWPSTACKFHVSFHAPESGLLFGLDRDVR